MKWNESCTFSANWRSRWRTLRSAKKFPQGFGRNLPIGQVHSKFHRSSQISRISPVSLLSLNHFCKSSLMGSTFARLTQFLFWYFYFDTCGFEYEFFKILRGCVHIGVKHKKASKCYNLSITTRSKGWVTLKMPQKMVYITIYQIKLIAKFEEGWRCDEQANVTWKHRLESVTKGQRAPNVLICLGCNKDLRSRRSKYKSYGALRGCDLGVRDCLQVYCGK